MTFYGHLSCTHFVRAFRAPFCWTSDIYFNINLKPSKLKQEAKSGENELSNALSQAVEGYTINLRKILHSTDFSLRSAEMV